MTSPRWANLWALIGGLSLGLMLCGTGHAETLQVTCVAGCIDLPRCVKDLSSVLQKREDVDTLQRRVNTFYRMAVVDEDGECVNCIPMSSGTGWTNALHPGPGRPPGGAPLIRLGSDYVVTPEGTLYYDLDRPKSDPKKEGIVKKTEEELYQEQKAKILEQLTELDRERSRKKEQAKRDAQYEHMKEELEEAKGHLIVSWETVKRRCVR